MNSVASGVGAFIALLGAAVIISIVAERLRIPAAVALVAVGAIVQIAPPFAFGDTLLFIYLPPLIFEAAWNIDLDAMRRMAWRIVLLALPGTLFTAFGVAAALTLTGLLPAAPAFLFGAIVAATDPVAVVAAFRRVRVPSDIRTLVEAESLANDGVSLILFAFGVVLAASGTLALADDAVRGILEVLGGTLIGVACGFVCAGVLLWTNALEYEVTITIVLAYVAYLAASALHCSGIFATAAGAIALRAVIARRPSTLRNADDVDRVWVAAAFIANAVVFLATGLLIQPERLLHEPMLVIVAIASVWLTRAVLALVATRERAGRITVFLAGMRGALPLALALGLPASLPYRPQIIDATFAVVLVTIVAQGVPLQPVLTRLYAGASDGELH